MDFQASTKRFCLFSLCFSPCGRSLLGGASDRAIYLHSVELNRPLIRVPGAHADDVNAVAYLDGYFSGGRGDAILTGGDDHVVKLWDLRLLGGAPDADQAAAAATATPAAVTPTSSRTPRPVSVFAGHSQGITSLSSRGDGRHFLTNSKDQSCKLFDVRLPSSAHAPPSVAASSPSASASASVASSYLPGGAGQAEAAARTDAQEAQWDYRWPTHVTKAACQERARQAQLQAQQAAVTRAAEGARKGCAASSAVSACLAALSPALSAPFAAAASSSACPSTVDAALSSLSSSNPRGGRIDSGPGVVSSGRASSTDTSLVTFTGHRVLETLIRAYFSPLSTTGQRFVYSGSQCGSVFVWDVLTGEVVQRLRAHYGTVRDAAWHPRDAVLVSASWDCSLARWEMPQA